MLTSVRGLENLIKLEVLILDMNPIQKLTRSVMSINCSTPCDNFKKHWTIFTLCQLLVLKSLIYGRLLFFLFGTYLIPQR